MEIRKLRDDELQDALKLVWNVFLLFDAPYYTDEGIKEFKDSIDNPEFIEKLEIFGAFDHGKLLGIVATRDKHHISQFFVHQDYHRKGIGRDMYNYIKDLNDDGYFTVNSSIYAKEFYEKLGFICMSDEQCVRGLRFYPMKIELTK